MKTRELLIATMEELKVEEKITIEGGNPTINLIQSIISAPFGPTFGNCVTIAKNWWGPSKPTTTPPSKGVGCTKR